MERENKSINMGWTESLLENGHLLWKSKGKQDGAREIYQVAAVEKWLMPMDINGNTLKI